MKKMLKLMPVVLSCFVTSAHAMSQNTIDVGIRAGGGAAIIFRDVHKNHTIAGFMTQVGFHYDRNHCIISARGRILDLDRTFRSYHFRGMVTLRSTYGPFDRPANLIRLSCLGYYRLFGDKFDGEVAHIEDILILKRERPVYKWKKWMRREMAILEAITDAAPAPMSLLPTVIPNTPTEPSTEELPVLWESPGNDEPTDANENPHGRQIPITRQIWKRGLPGGMLGFKKV
jgi:hypothetical protein